MKREDKNAFSRQRILDAAISEFSEKGYGGASLNNACEQNGISKGVVYHYFTDKDEIYLQCVKLTFDKLTSHLQLSPDVLRGSVSDRLSGYFYSRLQFFAKNPILLNIFAETCFRPPAQLKGEIALIRTQFDKHSACVLTELLSAAPLRAGLDAAAIVEDFCIYMDFFNMRFADGAAELSSEAEIKQHEERCHRQLDILLHGVLA